MSLLVCGCDPGKSGAVAILDDLEQVRMLIPVPLFKSQYGKEEIDAFKLHETFVNFEAKDSIACWNAIDLVVMENVHGMGWHRTSSGEFKKDSTTTAFSFGQATGKVHAVFEILGLRPLRVPPQVWKRQIVGDSTKESSIEFCKKKWPNQSLLRTPKSRTDSHDLAEALLLALYGIKHLKGELPKPKPYIDSAELEEETNHKEEGV